MKRDKGLYLTESQVGDLRHTLESLRKTYSVSAGDAPDDVKASDCAHAWLAGFVRGEIWLTALVLSSVIEGEPTNPRHHQPSKGVEDAEAEAAKEVG